MNRSDQENKKIMHVYSGDCRICDCGIDTGKEDAYGKPLFTGDIVITYTEHYLPDHLTVIVSDQYQSFSDGSHVLTGNNNTYPMGIKRDWLDPDNEKRWMVRKLKDHSDVVNGEHWPAFCFRYEVPNGKGDQS